MWSLFTRKKIGMLANLGMFPILNILIFEHYKRKEKRNDYFSIKSATPFVVTSISNNLALSAFWFGMAYVIGKFGFKHDVTKSLKIAGIVAGSVCAGMFIFSFFNFLARTYHDNKKRGVGKFDSKETMCVLVSLLVFSLVAGVVLPFIDPLSYYFF